MVSLTLEDAQRRTNDLAEALRSRRPDTQKQIDYYKGEQGTLKFASKKFTEHFKEQFKGFSDNWCAPVADASPERMNLLGLRPYDARTAHADLNRAWEEAGADAGLTSALQVRSAARRSFALVSPGRRPDRPRVTFESPLDAIVDEDPATGERRAGLIMWADDDVEYATLYTPDEVWKWERETAEKRHERQGRPVDPNGGWEPRKRHGDLTWPARNPLGAVPLVELPNRDLLDDEPISEISGVMAMQDALNSVWAFLLQGLDAASLPQRIITGAEAPSVPVLDKDGQVIGRRPIELDDLLGEKILWINNTDAKASEWSAAMLEPFSKVIEQMIGHIAAQTRTPPHYLATKIINAAADTLTISEAGLVSRTRQSITHVNPRIREIYRLMAVAMRLPADEVNLIAAGVPMWADIQYRSEAQRADALVKKRQMGYPMRWILQEDGRTPEEIDMIMDMIREEQGMDVLAAQHHAATQVME